MKFEKCFDSGYILKVEAKWFPDGLHVRCAIMSSETDRVYQEFDFGQAKFEMPIKHLRGEFTLPAGYTTLGFIETWAWDKYVNIKKGSYEVTSQVISS